MPMTPTFRLLAVAAVLVGLICAPRVLASGFSIFEQSGDAVGLAGAVAANPYHPSSLFYNVGAAAFLKEPAYAGGVQAEAGRSANVDTPTSGTDAGSRFDVEDPSAMLVHAYVVQPIAARLNVGVAVYSPFDLETSWSNPDTFPGRDVSSGARLETMDASFNAAARFGETFGAGIGLIVRTSSLSLSRRLQTNEPLADATVDFAQLDLSSDNEVGVGWTLGFLHQPTEWLSWGASYRSKIEIDYGGNGIATQIPTGNDVLDEAIAVGTPFDEDLPFLSLIEFPDVATLGVAFGSERLRVEANVNWTGWSSVAALPFSFETFSPFDDDIRLELEDTMSYRLGIQLGSLRGDYLRAGLAFEETPLPDGMLSPFLVDSDRTIVALGYGRDWLEIGAQWSHFSRRDGSSSVVDSFDGTFSGDSYMLTVTIRKPDKLPDGVEIPDLPEPPEVAAPDLSSLEGKK